MDKDDKYIKSNSFSDIICERDLDIIFARYLPHMSDNVLLSCEMGSWKKRDYKAIIKEEGSTIQLLKSDFLENIRDEIEKLQISYRITYSIFVRNGSKWLQISEWAN